MYASVAWTTNNRYCLYPCLIVYRQILISPKCQIMRDKNGHDVQDNKEIAREKVKRDITEGGHDFSEPAKSVLCPENLKNFISFHFI